MLAISASNPRVAAGVVSSSSGGRGGGAPCLNQQHRAPRVGRLQLQARAYKEGGSSQGNGTKTATPEQVHTTKMINLCTAYFDELMSKGNTEACHRLLAHNVEHKDMVRNEGRFGVEDYERYIHDLKKAYPQIYVKPTQFGVVDNHTLFVAFEGRATEHTPLFKGVDLFYFNDTATKIKEVQVYRSNWLGAQGHEERKKKTQQEAQQVQHGQQPGMTT